MWNNSGAYAEQGTVRFAVAGDMTADGFNAYGKHIVADVGGNLDLLSKQNTSYSSGSKSGFNAGFGSGHVSGGVDKRNSKGNREWTDTTSSLVGTESVDINAGGRLGLSGSVIANIKEDGRDGGNLRISAASLEFADLQDRDKYENRGFGVDISTGHSLPDKAPPSGTTSISLTHEGHDTQGVTRATIGQGTITLAGVNTEPAGLNRDLDRLSEITSDKITGALDATMSIDNRVFTGAGWTSMIDDVKNLPENLVDAGEGVRKGIINIGAVFGDMAKTFADAMSGTGNVWKNGVIGTIGDKISRRQFENELANICPSCADAMNGNREYSFEEMEAMARIMTETAQRYGIGVGKVIYYAGDQYDRGGFYSEKDGNLVALKLFDNEGNFIGGEDGVRTAHHEFTHPRTKNEVHAGYMGEFGLEAHSLVNFLNGWSFYDPGSYSAVDWLAANGDNQNLRDNTAYAMSRAPHMVENDLSQFARGADYAKRWSGGDQNREMELLAAMCAVIHCADGVHVDNKNYGTYLALQEAGNAPERAADRELFEGEGLKYWPTHAVHDGLDSSAFGTWFKLSMEYNPVTMPTMLALAPPTDFRYIDWAGIPEAIVVGPWQNLGSDDPTEVVRGIFGVGDQISLIWGLKSAPNLFRAGAREALAVESSLGRSVATELRGVSAAEAWVSHGGFPAWMGEVASTSRTVIPAGEVASTLRWPTWAEELAAGERAATSSGSARNAALAQQLNLDLKTVESANAAVDSLKATGRLPDYYVTKATAEAAGWSSGKALGPKMPGKQIGGDIFENKTGVLPNVSGRVWYEADIGISNVISRSKQPGTRLLYSNDGLLFMTRDHYNTVVNIGRWK